MHHGYTQAEGVANLDEVPGDRLPGRHRLPEVRGRPRRLRALHRDLPAVDAKNGVKISGTRRAAAQARRDAALGRDARGCASAEPEHVSGAPLTGRRPQW